MKTLSIEENEYKVLDQIVKVLRQGGLVVFPSDTVYGLLVDATNEQAVQKLLEFKNRPRGKPISVFIAWEMLPKVVKVEKPTRKRLHELLPGPYTIILPSRHKTSLFLESEDKTLGVRIPDHPLINRLVTQFDKPITATSANLSGRSPHYSISSFLNPLSKKKKKLIDLIIDGGTLPRNKPSTVIDMTKEKLKILRKGDVGLKEKSTYISYSEEETKKIAKEFIKKLLEKKQEKPVVLILKGYLGSGKTIFVKGIGEYFGVRNIISPTYVVYYEYDIPQMSSRAKRSDHDKLIHVDLYNVQETEEFKHLRLEKYLKPGNLLCVEWGEKAGDILPLLQSKSSIVMINIEYESKEKRKIIISF